MYTLPAEKYSDIVPKSANSNNSLYDHGSKVCTLFSAHCTVAACPVSLGNSSKLYVDLKHCP